MTTTTTNNNNTKKTKIFFSNFFRSTNTSIVENLLELNIVKCNTTRGQLQMVKVIKLSQTVT